MVVLHNSADHSPHAPFYPFLNGWVKPVFPKESIVMVTDRILEMQKGSRAAGIGKGSGPKPRQKISDITDFQKKEVWK